ncbi:hypothetical protein [Clostridium hydrogenum]|uniref:hypothetical protein n=1 Tax=Clostridium hydrogenum TaxID=2855764 RepID=UPI001F2E4166|nr:hypothetical protein [Clostridium hydrogenum]
MKKLILVCTLVATVVTFSACNSSSQSNKTVTTTTKKAKAVVSSSANTNKSDNNNDDVVITDISSWDHPAKKVFNDNSIKVNKVELKDNKTYPIFYVSLSRDLDAASKNYYLRLMKSIAAANNYWDYEVKDENKDVDIKVTCENKTKLKSIEYNKDSNYFAAADVQSVANEDDYINYLKDNVPEVKSFVNVLTGNKNAKPIIYVDRYPDSSATDKYKRDYYDIYVGEELVDHTTNTYRFGINKDTKEIVYYDLNKNTYESLEEWRNSRK